MNPTNHGDRQPFRYLAHSANHDGTGVAECLRDHLLAVAQRAATFARPFGAEQQAYAAGLLHDLGKYSERFLRHLRRPHERAGDHWSAGALILDGTKGGFGAAPAVAVAGHHGVLPELPSQPGELAGSIAKRMKDDPPAFSDTNARALYDRYLADGLPDPEISAGLDLRGGGNTEFAANMLDARMLVSALVDADFLETEAHFEGDAKVPRRPRPEGPALDVDEAIAALDRQVDLVRQRFADAPMAASRDALFRQCVAAAALPTGPFSLSAPTGAGKTLAMLALALHHARRHDLRRVILVLPFLNIIEQTAAVYRSIFSPENGFNELAVLEHHSLVDFGERPAPGCGNDHDNAFPRLLTENWDAPIILTTSVQFFESLMAARPSRCRKLHRLARSVILFDEVQTLPVKLAVATLATLSRLTDPNGPYHSSVVFATATQPAFDALHERVRPEFASSGWQPKEIVTDPQPLFTAAARRVQVSWRHEQAVSLPELAEEVAQCERVLCIVNLKRHASELVRELAEHNCDGLAHLSTNMCPAHRTAALDTVRQRLADGRPVRLMATQCVEAGVDLDFPVVYRALAPLEAIAQAAGRCNRHGGGPPGRVVVFKPLDDRGLYPPGYNEAVTATETFLKSKAVQRSLDETEILNCPDSLRAYYRQLYSLSGRVSSERDDERELLDQIRAGSFEEVARLYRLIKQDSINILVRYDGKFFDELAREIRDTDRITPDVVRDWTRRATPHAVSMIRPRPESDLWNHLEPVPFRRRNPLENYEATWFFALSGLTYESLTGLSPPEDNLLIL